jgi:hypothetical protein
MKRFSFAFIFVFLSISVAHGATKAPKYGPDAIRLHDDHAFIMNAKALDYWALSPYYVSQQDGGACILASFAMTLNALRADDKLTVDDALISQAALLKAFSSEPAIKRFYINKGKSLSLEEMADFFVKASDQLIHKKMKVDVIYANDQSSATLQKVEKILIENEKSPKNFVEANFLQNEYTGDPEGKVGHVAPVAAYDAKQKRVLILDPDREYYDPYWVSLKTFVRGLNTFDHDTGKNRGIVWIHE